MGMNGRIGRAKTLRAIWRERMAQAKRMGIDTTDRRAMAAWNAERERTFYQGIREQLRCGCNGNKHTIITTWEGR